MTIDDVFELSSFFYVLHILFLPEAAPVHSKRTDASDDHT